MNDSDTLISLGLDFPKRGCIYVEDRVAELFLKTILQKNTGFILSNYDIEVVNGYAEITKRLEFPYSSKIPYKIIGIYDGDMEEKIYKIQDNLKWNFSFLPIVPSVEEEFILCMKHNLDIFAKRIMVDVSIITSVLSRIQGEDHHDWFINFCKGINKDMSFVMIVIYDIWFENPKNKDRVDEFVQKIEEFCK